MNPALAFLLSLVVRARAAIRPWALALWLLLCATAARAATHAPATARAISPWIAPLTSYGLIGYGASQVYAPAGPLAVGGLLWLDLYLYRR